jgi:hypothetical protein
VTNVLRGTSQGTASSSTSLSVPVVSGTAAGDLIIIFGTAVNATLSAIAGFTDSGNIVASSNNARAYVKRADGTESGSFAITLASAKVGAAICAVYETPASTDPLAIPSVYVSGSGLTTLPVPAITLTGSSDWLAWFGAGTNTTTAHVTLGLPSGFTARETVVSFDNGALSCGMIFGDIETSQSPGSTGTKTGTMSPTGRGAGWLAGISPTAPPSVSHTGLLL